MVFPIGVSENTMFQPNPFNLNTFIHDCTRSYGVAPRPHWITSYYGGNVSIFFSISSQLFSYIIAINIYFTLEIKICRILTSFSRSLVATSYFQMGCEILSVRAGKYIFFYKEVPKIY